MDLDPLLLNFSYQFFFELKARQLISLTLQNIKTGNETSLSPDISCDTSFEPVRTEIARLL